MSADALRLFLSQQIEEAKNQNVLFLYTKSYYDEGFGSYFVRTCRILIL